MLVDVAGKSNLVEIISGYYQAILLQAICERDMVDALYGAVVPESLAKQKGLKPEVVIALLEFLFQTTDMIDRSEQGEYSLSSQYRAGERLRFFERKFIGAYGGSVQAMLKGAAQARTSVDELALALAFNAVSAPSGVIVDVIEKWGAPTLLDLGCGVGSLLVEMARRDSRFFGYGVDCNAEMCRVATKRAADAHCDDRLRFYVGDVRDMEPYLPEHERSSVRAVYGSSILNEFFANDGEEAIGFLRKLRALFPGRLLFVVDYYGKLLRISDVDRRFQHTLLQDLVQVATGQGVPPVDLEAWGEVYTAASCRLVHAYQAETDGIEWFVHVVQL